MIDIKHKRDCCGCSACVQKCLRQCISLQEDNEGFLYPVVDKEICIDCGLCEKVCPILYQGDTRKPLKVYAAINKDEEIRRQSSSGGVFTLLAEKVINEGGVVFGARFDENWEVRHDYAETIEELAVFRGSKYVQSRIEDNFKKAETFLKEGRKVLFSGTPCQIAGLNRFLRKKYDNLLSVDFICHGVPSPSIFRWYIINEIGKIKKIPYVNYNLSKTIRIKRFTDKYELDIKNIVFRYKNTSWKNYNFLLNVLDKSSEKINCLNLEYNVTDSEHFLYGFIHDYYLRPSCYYCRMKNNRSGSDITLADFWGIEDIDNEFKDDKGVSLLSINTLRSGCWIKDLCLFTKEFSVDIAFKKNPSAYSSVSMKRTRKKFWKNVYMGFPFELCIKNSKLNLIERLYDKINKKLIR